MRRLSVGDAVSERGGSRRERQNNFTTSAGNAVIAKRVEVPGGLGHATPAVVIGITKTFSRCK
jgi:hypothetical protein